MKKNLSITAALLAYSLLFVSCDRGAASINASSTNTLYRSMTTIKKFVAKEKRIPFEVSFWSLKRTAGSEEEFRKLIHGKDADEVIALGKENFVERHAAGDKDYVKHGTWENMIAALEQEFNGLGPINRRDRTQGTPLDPR